MDSPSAPAVPDPVLTAQAQGQAGIDAAQATAQLNRVDQYTPYGSLTYDRGPAERTFNQQRYDDAMKDYQKQMLQAAQSGRWVASGPGGENQEYISQQSNLPTPDRNSEQFYDMKPSMNWTSKVTLDPRVQALLDAQLGTSQGLQTAIQSSLGRVNDTFSTPGPVANEEMRKRVEDALYQRNTSRLDPQFQQRENETRSTLMNRGMVEGSEGWQRELDNFNRGRNDAYSMARNDSIAQAGSEESRQLAMELASRNNVLNELSSLRTGAAPQMPSFEGAPSAGQVVPAPIAQSAWNAYQGQMGQYNAEVGSNNATMSAGAGATAAIIAAVI